MFKTHSSYAAVATHNHALTHINTHTLLLCCSYPEKHNHCVCHLQCNLETSRDFMLLLVSVDSSLYYNSPTLTTNYECVCLHDVIIKDIHLKCTSFIFLKTLSSKVNKKDRSYMPVGQYSIPDFSE